MEWSHYLIAVIVATAVYVAYWFYDHFTYWKRQGIPSHKFITFEWASIPFHEFIRKYSSIGKLYGAYGVTHKVLVINDPQIARDLSIKEFHKFPIRNSNFFGTSNVTKSVFFMPANDDWKRIRSIVTPAFTSGKLKDMLSPINSLVHNFVENLRQYSKTGEEFDIKRYTSGFAMDVISTCAYGISVDSIHQANHPIVENAKKILGVDASLSMIISMVFGPVAKLLRLEPFNKKAIDYFDNITSAIIENRMEKSQVHKDLVGLMVENARQWDLDNQTKSTLSTESNKHQLKGITKDEISGQGIIFFLAGFDTTNSTFCHIIYYLVKHPEWQEKLYEEIKKNKDNLHDYDVLKTLPILNAVINETLRLNPPLTTIQRESIEDCTLLDTGIKIPKNTLIAIHIYVIHRDPEYFPEPDQFKPERFFDKPPPAFMPFGVGPRLCIGMRFAQNELRIGVANLILNYKLKSKTDFELEYYRGNILMTPKNVMVQLSERN